MATTRLAPALRVSDAERERVADLLRQCCGEGRIGLEELSERLDGVYAARTGPDLAPLVADLPGGRGALPGAPAPRPERSPGRRRMMLAAWLAGLALLAAGLLQVAASAPLEAAILGALLVVIAVLLVEALLAALPALLVGWVVWRVVRFVRGLAAPDARHGGGALS